MTATETSFPIPFVATNSDSWGPPLVEEEGAGGSTTHDGFPFYAAFGRSDRLGRVADFTSHRGNQYNDRYGGSGGGRYNKRWEDTTNNPLTRGGGDGPDQGEESFQLVDTTKIQTTKRFMNPASKRRQQTQRLRQINARRQQSAGGGGPGSSTTHMDKMTRGGRGGGGRGRGGGRGGNWRGGGYHNRVDRQPSVAVRDDWKTVEEIDLGKFTKNITASTHVPTPQDMLWCGFLDPYNDAYDKVTTRQPVSLKRMDKKDFYYVSTTDDPVIEKFAMDGMGQIFITDTVLAHLMTCTRSVFPWDIVVHKLPGGVLFFDKRDNSNFDYMSVNETAYNPPSSEDGVNSAERLALEATMVNQNFSQQILKKSGRKDMALPNPFFDQEQVSSSTTTREPASVAYRYRKFALDDKTTLICRTELHGLVKKQHYMTAFCLNEYTPTNSPHNAQAVNWRDKIDSQRGAVFANELKNNSFKLAKWTAQSLLAGADQMKIGFCSRVNPAKPQDHVILATQFYRPKDFATQITLSETQMWAVFRSFVSLVMKQKDGKYVLMRNPNKAILHLYQVPTGTFEDDE